MFILPVAAHQIKTENEQNVNFQVNNDSIDSQESENLQKLAEDQNLILQVDQKSIQWKDFNNKPYDVKFSLETLYRHNQIIHSWFNFKLSYTPNSNRITI